MNPPTLVTAEGRLPVCAEHGAALARAGKVPQLPSAGELEGTNCCVCELEAFHLSAQSATTLVMETLEDGDPVLADERPPSVPVDMVALRRVRPDAFLLTFQDGSRFMVTLTPAEPVAL